MRKVGDLLREASCEIDRSEALLLLAKTLRSKKERLIAHPELEVSDSDGALFFRDVSRVKEGFPTTYLLGIQSFWGRDFKVTPDVLIPRPDTETLLETSLSLLKEKKSPRILDLGTGSGILAISLALEVPEASVTALDVSTKALDVARENARNLKTNVRFLESNWFSNLEAGTLFDLIVSNPPYIHKDDSHLENLSFEPRTALTDDADGLTNYRLIIPEAHKYLSCDGILAFEHGFDQGEAVREIFDNSRLYKKAVTVTDLGGRERVTYASKCPSS